MAREILSGFGPERSVEGNRASSGGVTQAKQMSYSPPQGPTNIMDRKSPGIHGDNYGSCGTQGSYSDKAQSSGSPGLHGSNHGKGTNR